MSPFIKFVSEIKNFKKTPDFSMKEGPSKDLFKFNSKPLPPIKKILHYKSNGQNLKSMNNVNHFTKQFNNKRMHLNK